MEGLGNTASERVPNEFAVDLGGYADPIKGHGRAHRNLRITALVFGAVISVAAVGICFYWQSLKDSPQYTLALLVDAAKRNDEETVNSLVDIDAVVDDFLPQVTTKAVEIYGRGLSDDIVARVAKLAQPLMPAVKDRARAELPEAIRQKTSDLQVIPLELIVISADRYLDISIEGNEARVTSRLPKHELEIRMRKDGSRWRVAGIRDERLASAIAQRIGQEIIAVAADGGQTDRSRLGVKNINEILNEAGKIFR